MKCLRFRYKGRVYELSNHGNGWDVYYMSKVRILVEQGCETLAIATTTATIHALGRMLK